MGHHYNAADRFPWVPGQHFPRGPDDVINFPKERPYDDIIVKREKRCFTMYTSLHIIQH